MSSNLVAVAETSNIVHVSSKEFFGNHVIFKYRFTLNAYVT